VLPLSVIVLALMGVGVAITYGRVSSERRIGSDQRAQVGAFAVAQSGLSRYLSSQTGKPGPSVNVSYNDLPGGTAQVSLRMIRESTTTLLPAVYVINSRGTYTASRRYSALIPPAERTVATYALWVPTPFDLNGAYTSLSGMIQNGAGSGGLSGIDRCTAPGGSQPAIPGVAVPGGTYSGSTSPIDGNPDNTPADLGTPGVAGTAVDEVDIDWAGIVAGTQLPPNYTYPTWPTSAQFDHWPIVRVDGNLTLPSSGKGILIVTGDLTWNGTPLKNWEGLILVGGNIISNGQANVYGAVITALNMKLGISVPTQTIGNGTKLFQYDSCALARAFGKIGSLERVRNGWTDNWSSY
jgi:hypothetical protein